MLIPLRVSGQPWIDRWGESAEKQYTVFAEDGTIHTLTVAYNSKYFSRKWQAGHSARPPKYWRDTRQCHWSFKGSVRSRSVSSLNTSTGDQNEHYYQWDEAIDQTSYQGKQDSPFYAFFVDTWTKITEGIDATPTNFETVESAIASTLGLFASLTIATHSGVGNALGRALGFRRGVNCGEAEHAFNSSYSANQATFASKSKVLVELDYYLSALKLSQHWYYQNEEDGWVNALVVLPAVYDPTYHEQFKLLAMHYASRYVGRPLRSDEVTHLANMPKSPAYFDYVRAAAIHFLSRDLDADIDDLIAATPENLADMASFIDDHFQRLDAAAPTLSLEPHPPSDIRSQLDLCKVGNGLIKSFFAGRTNEDPETHTTIVENYYALRQWTEGIIYRSDRIAELNAELPEEQRYRVPGEKIVRAVEYRNRIGSYDYFFDLKDWCESIERPRQWLRPSPFGQPGWTDPLPEFDRLRNDRFRRN